MVEKVIYIADDGTEFDYEEFQLMGQMPHPQNN